MAAKVTVNLPQRLIQVKAGVTELDARTDLYSALKEEWRANLAGEMAVEFPFRTIGGDPLGGGLVAGAYFFLQNQRGWRIRPQEFSHELTVTGNLYAEEPSLPVFIPTTGTYTVSIRLQTSSLTQLAGEVLPLAPLPEIAPGALPHRPTWKEALVFFYMALRNRLVTTDDAIKYHDSEDRVVATAQLVDDGTKSIRHKAS